MLSEPLLEWQNSGEYLTYQGYQVFSKVSEGSNATPLLLIHGFPSSSYDWYAVWPLLEKHFKLITADMLGFGLSDKPVQFNYSIPAQADLYAHLIETLNLKSVHILSHDYGDTVAQELLARHQEGSLGFDIKSVTFLNGGLFPETHKPLLVQRLLMSSIGGWVAKLMTHQKFTANFKRICSDSMTSEDIDLLWEQLQFNNGRAVIPKLIYYMQERKVNRSRWVGALEQSNAVAIPLHLIDGVIDPISGAHLVKRFRELIPGARVTELPEIGHYPQVEAPESVVQAFIAGLKSSSSANNHSTHDYDLDEAN